MTSFNVLLVIFFLWGETVAANLPTNITHGHNFLSKHYWMREAVLFIQSVQNNCSAKEYSRIQIGVNGGFSAQFQLAAGEFMKTLAAGDYKVPIEIFGTLNGYSQGEECKHASYQWTCFFHPATKCTQSVFAQNGAEERQFAGLPSEDDSVPPRFRHLGTQFWWGAVQRYLFKLQPFVNAHIAKEADHEMHPHYAFPFGLPMAGIHVRHGDKSGDGFHTHSLDEELGLVRNSPDCQLLNSKRDCFVRIQFADNNHSISGNGTLSASDAAKLPLSGHHVITAALQRRTIILREADIERYDCATKNTEILVDPLSLQHALRSKGRHHQATNSRAPNTTSIPVAPSNLLSVSYVIPLAIYIASDDGEVIKAAEKRGYFCDPAGVSQSTNSNGMLKTLLSHFEFGYNATMEIISDIYFLSHSSTLVGMAASQVFRMSVALSNVSSTLHHAKATDMNQVERTKMLSRKYHVPFVEIFE